MDRARRIGVAIALLATVSLGAPGAHGTPAPPCLTWRTEARYRNYGYDHLVHIHNGCDQRAACAVSTSANPDQIRVSIGPGGDVTVVTFVGSPSRDFTATVSCTLEPG
jgi:hypothetical protein